MKGLRKPINYWHSQRMHYNFPTYCCLIELDSINTADGCKKEFLHPAQEQKLSLIQACQKKPARTFPSPQTSIQQDDRLPFTFYTDLQRQWKAISPVKRCYLISISCFWWHSCGLTSWENIFLLLKLKFREESILFIIHTLGLEICLLATSFHKSCCWFFFSLYPW